MRVKMLIDLGHGPFGRWPEVGTEGDVPEPHASHAIKHGYAVPAGKSTPAPEPETATDEPTAETAASKKPPFRKR